MSLLMTWRHSEAVEFQVHWIDGHWNWFLNWSLNGGKLSASRPGRFTTRQKPPEPPSFPSVPLHREAGWFSTEGLEVLEKRNIFCPCRNFRYFLQGVLKYIWSWVRSRVGSSVTIVTIMQAVGSVCDSCRGGNFSMPLCLGAVDRKEWLVSRPCRFTPGEKFQYPLNWWLYGPHECFANWT